MLLILVSPGSKTPTHQRTGEMYSPFFMQTLVVRSSGLTNQLVAAEIENLQCAEIS